MCGLWGDGVSVRLSLPPNVLRRSESNESKVLCSTRARFLLLAFPPPSLSLPSEVSEESEDADEESRSRFFDFDLDFFLRARVSGVDWCGVGWRHWSW